MDPLMVSPTEAARLTGLSRSRIYLEVAAGRMKSVKAGRARRIPTAALFEYIERLVGEQAMEMDDIGQESVTERPTATAAGTVGHE